MKQIISITISGQKKIERHVLNQIKHCLKKIGLSVEKISVEPDEQTKKPA